MTEFAVIILLTFTHEGTVTGQLTSQYSDHRFGTEQECRSFINANEDTITHSLVEFFGGNEENHDIKLICDYPFIKDAKLP